METNPNVEPDTPIAPDEASTQATPPDVPSSEAAGPVPTPEIAAETAAAEALPEPLAEVAAEAPLQAEEATEMPEPVPETSAEIPPEHREEVVEAELPAGESMTVPDEETTTPQAGSTEEERAAEIDQTAPEEVETVETSPVSEELVEEPSAGVSEVAEASTVSAEAAPPAGEAGSAGDGLDALATLATNAQTTRLSPSDEERATVLLKEALLDGRAGVARAILALPQLPWSVGVNAVTAVWPEMKLAFRSQLLAGLVRTEGDSAKRMRLSLARGLFKQDVPIALKIVVGVAREMRDRETGAMNPKHAQMFANVLIGRAKPWIAQLPLGEVKPNDADVLVNCALLSAFSLPHAPITQLGVMKWAAEAGKLGKVHQVVVDAAQKSLSRWSGKWQNVLRKEVPDLPEAFATVLKTAPSTQKGTEEQEPEQAASEPVGSNGEEARAVAEDANGQPVATEPDSEAEAAEVESDREISEEEQEPDAAPAEAKVNPAQEATLAPQPKSRPVYESKTVPRKPQQGQQHAAQQTHAAQQQSPPGQSGKGTPTIKDASVPELLRQLESQFQQLRTELSSTQGKLRQREDDLRRAQKKGSDRGSAPIIEGEPTPEELARLNRQLESRNQELQARIEELLADSEARAVSMGAVGGEPVNDLNQQLRTLLALKLQEDFDDFRALERESPDIVVQQHYRALLRHVFEVLTQEGVQFEVAVAVTAES